MSLGVFCTSPIESLLIESGLPELETKRNFRVLIGGRIQESERRAQLKVATFLRAYNNTFGNRFQRLLVSLDVHRSQLIRENRIKKMSLWAFHQLNVDINLTRMKKADTSNEEAKKH
jgi:hypothetical protein